MIKHFTLSIALLLAGTAFAQIPNASFENWTHTATSGAGGTAGYDQPVSWGTANAFISTLDSVYTCSKGTTGAPAGSSYISLTTKTVLITAVPGVAVTGSINVSGTTYSVSGGFPNTTRYANLTGMWKYSASGADDGHIVVFLSKWDVALNRRDTVSFTNYALPATAVTSWTSFSIPLAYQKGSIPDTAMVVLASSGTSPIAGSYLDIDTLAFTGTVLTGVVTVVNNDAPATLYPNPARDKSNIYYYSLFSGDLHVTISDISGRIVRQTISSISIGSNNIPLDISGLEKGVYLVYMNDGIGTACKKLVVD